MSVRHAERTPTAVPWLILGGSCRRQCNNGTGAGGSTWSVGQLPGCLRWRCVLLSSTAARSWCYGFVRVPLPAHGSPIADNAWPTLQQLLPWDEAVGLGLLQQRVCMRLHRLYVQPTWPLPTPVPVALTVCGTCVWLRVVPRREGCEGSAQDPGVCWRRRAIRV